MENTTNKRCPNFTNSERALLIKIVNGFSKIIENKKTDGTTWREKENAWLATEGKFNASTLGPPRTAKQLKYKYESIKKKLKKKHSQHKLYVKGTGGGSYRPPPEPETEEEKILSDTISLSIEGLRNPFDSDQTTFDVPSCSNEMQIEYDAEEFQNHLEDTPSTSDDLILVDWSHPSAKLLQTPKHAVLNSKSFNQDVEAKEEDHAYASRASQKVDLKSNTWENRRHPVFKKKQSMSSTALKFESLAAEKVELINIEKRVALRKLEQIEEEHELKMQILRAELEIKF